MTSSTYCTCTGSTTVITCRVSACVSPKTEKVFVKVTVNATFNTSFNWGITLGGHHMGLPTSTPLKATSELQVQP